MANLEINSQMNANIDGSFLVLSDFQEKILQITRVTKIVKGGRKLSFRITVIVSCIQKLDNYRMIGLGVGKSRNYNIAILKAIAFAKKNFVSIPTILTNTIPYQIKQKFNAAFIILTPASAGTGIKAGGATRAILELAGFKNITAKQHGSSSLINNAQATIRALKNLYSKK
jgi:small subunit ribosomal protein S5